MRKIHFQKFLILPWRVEGENHQNPKDHPEGIQDVEKDTDLPHILIVGTEGRIVKEIVADVIEIALVQDGGEQGENISVFIDLLKIPIHRYIESLVTIFGSLAVPCWANRP